jgi:leucyl-tRNA synthetase
VRAYLMFIGPWDQGGPWNHQGIEGVTRFLHRVWALLVGGAGAGETDAAPSDDVARELRRAVHQAIANVTDHLEGFRFNTAVAELMTLQNAMSRAKAAGAAATPGWREACEAMTLLLAPIAPHLAEELWSRLGHTASVHLQAWPEADAAALVRDEVVIAVQVNGKLRGEVVVPVDSPGDELVAAAKGVANVARYLEGMQLVREIVVPGKLVNLVVKPQG